MILSTATYAMQLAISLTLVIIVSRLLLPAEIGAYLIASAVMILILPLRDFQIQSYVLQRDQIDVASLRPVAAVAWGGGAIALVIALAAAGIFGVAYPDQPIAACLMIMSLSLIFRPIALLPLSLLARDLRYGVLAIVQTSGALAKIAVTLLLIARGMGAEALAWGYVVELAVELLAIAFVSKGKRWVSPTIAGSSEVYRFAAPFAGANLVLTVTMAAIPIIIGGFLGLAASAFFNRARTVTQFFRSSVEGAVHQIVLQRFAGLRDDVALLRYDYLKSIALLTAISWPSLVWLFIVAEPLTLLLFGPRWAETAVLIQGLAIAGFFYSATAFSRQLHAAMEDTALLFRRDAWLQVPLLIAVLFAAQFSTVAVVGAVVSATVLSTLVHLWLLARQLDLYLWAYFLRLLPSAALALAVAAAVHGAMIWAGGWETLLSQVVVTGAVASLAWASALIILRHPLLEETQHFWREWRRSLSSKDFD